MHRILWLLFICIVIKIATKMSATEYLKSKSRCRQEFICIIYSTDFHLSSLPLRSYRSMNPLSLNFRVRVHLRKFQKVVAAIFSSWYIFLHPTFSIHRMTLRSALLLYRPDISLPLEKGREKERTIAQ